MVKMKERPISVTDFQRLSEPPEAEPQWSLRRMLRR